MPELRIHVEHPAPRTDATLGFIAESLGLTLRIVAVGTTEDLPHLIVGEGQGTVGDALVVPPAPGDLVWSELLDGIVEPAGLVGRVSFDLVGAIGRYLADDVHATADPAVLDGHGRLRYADSLPARSGRGDRAIVNAYVGAIGSALRQRFGLVGADRWPGGKRAAIALSHDVDQPDRYALLGSAVRPWRFRRRPRSYVRGSLRLARARLKDREPLDAWAWDRVAESEARLGFRSTFFVAATPFHHRHGADVDVAYDVRQRRFRPVLRALHDGGFEIGLHAGYRAYENPTWLADERERLRSAAAVEVDGIRHHFWHLGPDPAATLRSHETAGFRHDSSLAYNDHAGFRRSVALPFRPWDAQLGRPLRTLQIPTFCMDGNLLYESDDVDGAVAAVARLVDEIVQENGVGSIDWHIQASVPGTVGYGHWGVAYQRILAGLAARPDVWVTSHREIERWVTDRAADLAAGSGEVVRPVAVAGPS